MAVPTWPKKLWMLVPAWVIMFPNVEVTLLVPALADVALPEPPGGPAWGAAAAAAALPAEGALDWPGAAGALVAAKAAEGRPATSNGPAIPTTTLVMAILR
jgi:hypothetical protein